MFWPNTKQDYSRDAVRRYLIDNADTLLDTGTLYSCIVERMSADYDGDKFVDKNGYDQVDEDTKLTTEVKCTNEIQNPDGSANFRIQSYEHKRGLFNFMKVIESVNNRVFRIPHDDWFAHLDETQGPDREGKGEFRWSATYGQNDKSKRGVRPENTQFLLKYEVT